PEGAAARRRARRRHHRRDARRPGPPADRRVYSGAPLTLSRAPLTPSASANSIGFKTVAGAPAAIEPAGMSWVTTLFAPMTQRLPIVTPLVTTTFTPHQTLSPIRVGPLLVKPCQVIGLFGSSTRWLASGTQQPLASMQSAPIPPS